MFKHMKIGTKLFMGIGLLIILFGVIGLISWLKLNVVQDEASSLANAYVPEVKIAADVERTALKTKSEIQSYLLVKEEEYLLSGQEFLAQLKGNLKKASLHAEENGELVKLRENTPKCMAALQEYESNLDVGFNLINGLDNELKNAAVAGDLYMSTCEHFLTVQTQQMNREINAGSLPSVLTRRLSKITLVNDVIDLGNKARIIAYKAIGRRDPGMLEGVMNNIEEARIKLEALKKETSNPDRLKEIDITLENGLAYAESLESFGNIWIDLENIIDVLEENGNEVVRTAGIVTSAGIEGTDKIARITSSNVDSTLKIIMLIIGISALIGIIIAFVITKMITSPLKTIVALAKRAGSGDLTFSRKDFNYENRDELGQMCDALAEMIEAQRESVQSIMQETDKSMENAQSLFALSEETNASVEEIKGAIEHVASMSQENAAALEETNAGIQEISTTAGVTAQSSNDGASASSRTLEVANKAVGQVNNVVDTIEIVGGKSEEVSRTIVNLAEAVNAISKFVETITGIADQTNLLALNAAIEAARAGDAGMGFAVVADEVRKLSEESSEAAKEVGNLIQQLQSRTNDASILTKESGGLMAETVTGAKDAQTQLSTALEEINKINGIIQSIAASAQEQAAAAEEMAAGIDHVSTSNNQIAETIINIKTNSEETAKASENVANNAQEMSDGNQRIKDKLDQFKVELADDLT